MAVIFVGQHRPKFELTEPPSKARPNFKFSYSELRDIVCCAHRYQLITIEKLSTIDSSVIRRLLVANTLDDALTTWIGMNFTGNLTEIAMHRFNTWTKNNHVSWKHPMDKRDQSLTLQTSATALEKGMRENGLCQPDAKSQFNVRADIDLGADKKIRLTGRLDLVYTDNLWIFDLKTTNSQQWLDEKQLVFYDFVVSLMLGRKIKKCGFLVPQMNPCVQYLPNGGYVGKAEWDELFNKLNAAMSIVHSQAFPDTGDESRDCYMCFVKRYCRRYTGKGPQRVVQGEKGLKAGFTK